jgi:hypothetical protein
MVAGIPNGFRGDVVWTTPNHGVLSIEVDPMKSIELAYSASAQVGGRHRS